MLHPSFWLLRVLFRPTTFRPNGFCPSHCYRCRAIVQTGYYSGRSYRLRTIEGNGKLFGRFRGNLWAETLGGGGGGFGEGMFYERAGGPWGLERDIIGL